MSIFNRFNSQAHKTVRGREGEKPFVIKLITETKAEHGRARTFESKKPETLEWMRRYFRPGDLLWDMGANVGVYSLFAARLGAQVCAFEPHTINAARLLQNIELNDLSGRIVVYPFALGDRECMGTLSMTSLDPASSLHDFRDPASPTRIPGVDRKRPFRQAVFCSTADDLVREHGLYEPNHVKIDVDGAEKWVLKGMHRMLYAASGMNDYVNTNPFRGSLKTILVECHDDRIGPMRGLMRTYNFVEDADFPETSRQREEKMAKTEGEKWSGRCSCIFVKKQ